MDEIHWGATPCVAVAVYWEEMIRRNEVVVWVVCLKERISTFLYHTTPVFCEIVFGFFVHTTGKHCVDEVMGSVGGAGHNGSVVAKCCSDGFLTFFLVQYASTNHPSLRKNR